MATNNVVRENVRTVTVGGNELELEESLGTGVLYRNEFSGKLEDPYKGVLSDDILTLWNRAQVTVSEPELGEDGTPVTDEDGEPVMRDVPNPEYAGIDTEALLRVTWAMARAAGSTKRPWKAFWGEAMHWPVSVYEEQDLFFTVTLELGAAITFRRPEGRGGAEQADEAEVQQQAE